MGTLLTLLYPKGIVHNGTTSCAQLTVPVVLADNPSFPVQYATHTTCCYNDEHRVSTQVHVAAWTVSVSLSVWSKVHKTEVHAYVHM